MFGKKKKISDCTAKAEEANSTKTEKSCSGKTQGGCCKKNSSGTTKNCGDRTKCCK